jgi:hypothetical protein
MGLSNSKLMIVTIKLSRFMSRVWCSLSVASSLLLILREKAFHDSMSGTHDSNHEIVAQIIRKPSGLHSSSCHSSIVSSLGITTNIIDTKEIAF